MSLSGSVTVDVGTGSTCRYLCVWGMYVTGGRFDSPPQLARVFDLLVISYINTGIIDGKRNFETASETLSNCVFGLQFSSF